MNFILFYFLANFKRFSEIVPDLKQGSYKALDDVINDHINGHFPLCSLRSRYVNSLPKKLFTEKLYLTSFINGSTILHICSYYGHVELVEKLLETKEEYFDSKYLNPNIRDYKGATALHRAKDIRIIKLLLDNGADVNISDLDGNSPLHIRCYGEKDYPSEIEAIELLIHHKANSTSKNKKVSFIKN